MTAPPEFTGDEARDLAVVREAFPDWQIALTSWGWWATRGLTREEPGNALRAGSAEGMYRVLASQPRRPR